MSERPLLIEDLEISVRIRNALVNGTGFRTVAELCACSQQDLRALPGIGVVSLEEIKDALAEKGHWLGEYLPDGRRRRLGIDPEPE